MNDTTLQTFLDPGAYLRGHFRLTSGLHSAEYLQSAKVLQFPNIAERLAKDLAARMPKGGTVASPALGGLIIGHEVARAMGVRFIFTERDADGKIVGVIGVGQDITERKRAEAEASRVGNELRMFIDTANAVRLQLHVFLVA